MHHKDKGHCVGTFMINTYCGMGGLGMCTDAFTGPPLLWKLLFFNQRSFKGPGYGI